MAGDKNLNDAGDYIDIENLSVEAQNSQKGSSESLQNMSISSPEEAKFSNPSSNDFWFPENLP